MSFVIRVGDNYVMSYSASHKIVLMTPRVSRAQVFADNVYAQEFIDAYADRGYGLSSETVEIREVI